MSTSRPVRVLLAIDGSPSSDAAVNEVAHCTLFKGSAVEVLTVIHSRVPVIPDPAFTMLALRAEDLHQQESRAQALLDAAVRRIRRGRRSLTVSAKSLEGVPKDVIVREATDWGADRVVLGSHGHGPIGRALLGSTAAGVAADAPCSVHIARLPKETAV